MVMLLTTNLITSLCQTVKSVQYKAALAITGIIKGKSHAKLHTELGLGTLRFR